MKLSQAKLRAPTRQIPFSNDPGDLIYRSRHGFLYEDGDKVAYCAMFKTVRKKNFHLNALKAKIPAIVIKQDGDTEFIAIVDCGATGDILAASKAYKKKPAPANAFKPKVRD